MAHDDPTTAEFTPPDRDLPKRIGRYRILGLIGTGGFGSVYQAEQTEPVRRRVALKVVKPGMDSQQVLARFEAERQALAVMDHPGIAKFLDADLTEQGHPYFVMEYVRGVPIGDFCREERIGLEERVNLTIQVCNAVQHAHMKGVVHRDLKPANILVELIDNKPAVKVIDFGVAKALAQPLTDSTIYTEQGQMIGTPEYMSPEQARGSGVDIDTRADVYSLGAILYELLTGVTPFDSATLRDKGYAELQRVIEDEEAPRPSLRLSTIAKTPDGSSTTKYHEFDPASMAKLLKGDLDWIAMKCLAKERDRRYDTAAALGMDLQRYLDDEPVVAGPPSVTYRARKFVKRNKALVTGGVLVALTLLLGIAGTTGGMLWALDLLDRAEAAEAATQLELGRAQEIKRLISEMLSSVDPAEAQGADATLLVGILDDAAGRLARGEVADELIAAELHDLVGSVYVSLGRIAAADRHTPVALEIRRRILGEEHADTLRSMHNAAILYWNRNRFAEAESLYKQTLEIQTRVLGEEHTDTLDTMADLAFTYILKTQYDLAEALQTKVLDLRRRVVGEEHPKTLDAMINLSFLYYKQRRFAAAEPLYVESIELLKRSRGAEHPGTLVSLRRLAGILVYQGRYAEAESILVKNLESHERVQGMDHVYTARARQELAQLRMRQGRYTEAETMQIEAIAVQRQALGDGNPYTLDSRTKLGHLYIAMGRYDEAREIFESTLPALQSFWRQRSLMTFHALSGLAEAHVKLGQRQDGLSRQRELIEFQRAQTDDPGAFASELDGAAAGLLMSDFEELQEPDRALRLAERACALEEADKGNALWRYLRTRAAAQHLTGDTAGAIETQRRAINLCPDSAEEDLEASLRVFESALR